MTLAICTHCGGKKYGAFVACPECRHVPATEHDIIYALALSDHHFDGAKLDEIAQAIKAGQIVRLSQDQEDKLRPAAREYLKKHGAVIAMMQQKAGPQPAQREQMIEGGKRGGEEHSGLCFYCWAVKPVYAMPCEECGRRPKDEVEFVYSIAFSSTYHDEAALRQMSAMIRSGSPPTMAPDQIEKLRPAARALMERMNEIFKSVEVHDHATESAFAVPAHPNIPDIGYAQPTRMFQGGKYTVVFARDVKTLAERTPGTFSTIRYRYACAAADMTTGQPVLFVQHEGGFLGGDNYLCAFDSAGGHRNYGKDPALQDEAVFVQRAVALIENELGVRLSEQFPEALRQRDEQSSQGADDPNRAYKERVLLMLGEMKRTFTAEDLRNPTIKRLYQFTEDFTRFVANGIRSDGESDRLIRELEWMQRNDKVTLPPEACASMKHILRVEAPRAKARIAGLMGAHYECAVLGKGSRKQVQREIAAMKSDGLLAAEEAAALERALTDADDGAAGDRLRRLAAGENPSSAYGKKSWWQRLFS